MVPPDTYALVSGIPDGTFDRNLSHVHIACDIGVMKILLSLADLLQSVIVNC